MSSRHRFKSEIWILLKLQEFLGKEKDVLYMNYKLTVFLL